jgi:TolB-like protein/class 3 adenylate cyclase
VAERHVERRLAAILCADIVGYTRLTGVDEEGTIARLRALRSELIDPLIAAHRGRVVKRTGDGAIVEFVSVVDALRCALEVQRGMVARNASVAPAERIEFRIGVNMGDVVVEGADLFGDGVNIAARLEGIAEPGGICVSEDAWRQVKDKVAADFTDRGEQKLKNVARPVRVFAVAVATDTAAAGEPMPAPALALPDKPSIAVLPFQNMSGDPEQEYFADGMVEDIITGLSRVKWLFVIARNSSFAYKGRAADVKQVGRELGVRYVLEGSVRKAANRVRITGQLVEAERGRHLWAERYDRDLTDVFALQDELTVSVVAAIEPNLRQAEIERVRRKRPDNLDAYDLLLRALPSVYTCMPEGAAKSLPILERALAIEPTYALAHGFAAWAHEIIFVRAGMRKENHDGAIHHAHAAIEHGRGDAMALALGGFAIGMVEHDRKVAVEASETALALSASCAFAYLFGCAPVAFGGDAERAIDWGERAIRLSPLDSLNYLPQGIIGFGYFLLDRHEEAVVAARRAIQLNPGFSLLHGWLAAPLAKLGRIEEAKAASARLLALHPGFSSSRWCAAVGVAPHIVGTVIDAMRAAGLPE